MICAKMENIISKYKNVLFVLNKQEDNTDMNYLVDSFCGNVVYAEHINEINKDNSKKIYVCGDLNKVNIDIPIYIIEELVYPYDKKIQKENWNFVTLGQVPVVVAGMGVFFRKFFEEDDYFNKIKEAHTFQKLTISTKQPEAARTGIYLTNITKELDENKNEILNFRLLRCSSNLSGPTDNFRAVDHTVINALNEAVCDVFEHDVQLNHVLAQIYENNKGTKAKLKSHSDKTKDMPSNGLIAFCTFYDTAQFKLLKPSKEDRYDWVYKKTSGLTRLHFKLKDKNTYPLLQKEFTVTMYPNSVFIIPLSTNRLYTHEIKPSVLDTDKIPTRLGYVVRCSNMEAAFMDNQTFLKYDELVKLSPITEESEDIIRELYKVENTTTNTVVYDKINCSMNLGDYMKPQF